MPKLTIDGIEVEVAPGTSVLQACEQLGIEVPRFCYHERLSVPANCRMCLVEVERSPKPVASCAMPAGEGMVVKTNTDTVHKARKGVMEFLLINHPLDCPICDQGGECDLQDQAVSYGYDRGRYEENKRAVKDKYMGPLIRTYMTRCIQCTRCIRFVDEIAGVPALGGLARGEHLEITPALEAGVNSEMSGNLVDVCPVGALTSKPYAYNARPWELRKTESIDVMDAVGSNIRVDARGGEVLRVLPRLHEDVNEEWISDKTRYAIDGLKRQRLDRPYVRGADGKLKPATWAEAFAAIKARVAPLPGNKVAGIAGDLVDVESVVALKDLLTKLGSANMDCRQDGALFDASNRAGYIFNTGIAGIENADVVLLIGTNPRWEAPLVNARIRKTYLTGKLKKVAVVGQNFDLTYPTEFLGNSGSVLSALADGSHPFVETLKAAMNPLIILGAGALRRGDGLAVQAAARAIAENVGAVREGWNGFNVLHLAAGRVGALDAGFLPGTGGRDLAGILAGAQSGEIEAVYLLGADEIDGAKLGKAFVIYQGHHGDRGAHRADVILPGAAYTEKNATYVNTEGRVQHARFATFPLGEAREDWKILRALSTELGRPLPYDTLAQLRQRLVQVNPVFGSLDRLVPAVWAPFGQAGVIADAHFASPIENFYMTDPISRASQTMAQCTEAFLKPALPAAAAE
ncbi:MULTISPECIES: NADH-quinone oxidoreductase subunit NuoG [unclassified Azospirillum]|jgi:NADH-quinone oxidoreductase subunit G|uniref:NADH-quinone oxidoreductase subunit NuoG n=1 Tax=unclassified Azospirillum TaxID=2630922 RepID=UPI000B6BF072|nr:MULTISPECIES: NADH-quinone oxidoreductase subunit NuoG [unclassified Azospirillum]SNS41613.1 NADH dehydrogenase subunit G [Azospirillum sp. RU38E]SNS60228.1 NADH dehydrogenase subunit G [Azospirillum sp. RU37A]